MEKAQFRLTVNDAEHSVICEPGTPLLDVLRHDLGLAGPKFGCGTGLCGACFVLIEGRARASCDRSRSDRAELLDAGAAGDTRPARRCPGAVPAARAVVRGRA